MATEDNKKQDMGQAKKSSFDLASLQARLNSATLFTPTGLFNALYGSQVRGAVRDFAVNVTETVGTVVTGFNSEKGDKAADWLKNAWDKVAAHQDGKFDFRMASGWKMPDGMKFNGRLPTDPQYKGPKVGEEIQSFWSIFYRDKKGNIEAMDSSDPRFAHIVGPYIATQAALMMTVGTKGLTSLRSSLSVTNGVAAKVGTAAYLATASADLWGGAAQITKAVGHSLILKPEAIDRFSHLIDRADKLSLDQMQKDINLILEQYAKKEGRNTAQYFIPPITSPSNAMGLLDQLSKGQVKGYVRSNAFAEIPASAKSEDIHIGNIREVRENLYFQRAFLKLAVKALQGENMNESERFSLRFGMNIVLANKDGPLAVADNQSDFSLHAQALKTLRGLLATPILEAKFELHSNLKEKQFRAEDPKISDEDMKQKLSFEYDMWHADKRNKSVSNSELQGLVNERLSSVNAQISKQEQIEMQKLQAQAMALALH